MYSKVRNYYIVDTLDVGLLLLFPFQTELPSLSHIHTKALNNNYCNEIYFADVLSISVIIS